ncbi:unnamed protein product [Blepharisma stoltei]|uniref:6-pyruvoyltetrahydropterin synthase n=1 Tax=Blepharisma stoltei TaxID=1481888 RepID=A0AAU9K0G0_9CILI|nr:unnamed protein product [Blepharisma stoltei]
MSIEEGKISQSYELKVYHKTCSFDAAHILAGQNWQEELHGHGYTIAVTIKSKRLGADGFVVDFSVVKRELKNLCQNFHNKVLVASKSTILPVIDLEDHIRINALHNTFYELPKRVCTLLPIYNTSTEELAKYIADTIWEVLEPSIKEKGILEFGTVVSEVYCQQDGNYTMKIQD